MKVVTQEIQRALRWLGLPDDTATVYSRFEG
jgi:hypothetical protein